MVVTAPMMVVAEAEPVVVQLALMTGIRYQQEVVVVQDVTNGAVVVAEKAVVHHIDLMFQILMVLLVLILVKDMVVFHSITL